MKVQVDFAKWGPVWLAAGHEEVRWFTWAFDPDHWSLMQANPEGLDRPGSDAGQTGMSVQIVEQWIERIENPFFTRHLCRVKNIGAQGGYYIPQAIIAPSGGF